MINAVHGPEVAPISPETDIKPRRVRTDILKMLCCCKTENDGEAFDKGFQDIEDIQLDDISKNDLKGERLSWPNDLASEAAVPCTTYQNQQIFSSSSESLSFESKSMEKDSNGICIYDIHNEVLKNRMEKGMNKNRDESKSDVNKDRDKDKDGEKKVGSDFENQLDQMQQQFAPMAPQKGISPEAEGSKPTREHLERIAERHSSTQPRREPVLLSSALSGKQLIWNQMSKNPRISDNWPQHKVPKVISGSLLRFIRTRSTNALVSLGGGSYGHVYLGYHCSNGILVAIKVFFQDLTPLSLLLREAVISIWLNRTGVTPYCFGLVPVQFKTSPAAETNPNPAESADHDQRESQPNPEDEFNGLALVMEFIGNETKMPLTLGQLLHREYLRNKFGRGQVSDREWLDIYMSIAKAVILVHAANVTINDLKKDNVLLRKNKGVWKAYLCDFGFAIYLRRDMPEFGISLKNNVSLNSIRPFYAPELAGKSICGPKSDIYSYGYLLHNLIEKMFIIKVINLMRRCMSVEPSKRPTLNDIINELDQIKSQMQ